jgi:hypothetical protein
MRDAGPRDQSCIHTSLLQFRNSRGCGAKRHDLVVARMDRQNREPPPGSRCRRSARYWNHGAEAFREFLGQCQEL